MSLSEAGWKDGANHLIKPDTEAGWLDGTSHKVKLIEALGADGANHIVWRASDAQGHSVSGTIDADGSISYPEFMVSGSPQEFTWVHLYFDSPIAYTSGQTIMRIQMTTHFQNMNATWDPVAQVYWLATSAGNVNQIAEASSSLCSNYVTGVTDNINFVATSSGSSQDFYFGIYYDGEAGYWKMKSEGSAGCITFGGNQLKEIEII